MTSTHSEHLGLSGIDNKAIVLKLVRQMHLYLGVFFAPAILFFSLMGALQLFVLYEGHQDNAYQMPHHYGQPPRVAERPQATATESRGQDQQRDGKTTLVLKFFLALSFGLIAITMLGIYIASKYDRSWVLVLGLLIAGAAIPRMLIALSA